MKGREQTNQHREDANSEAAPCNLGGLLQLSSAAARATRRATANAMGKQEADSILLKVKSTKPYGGFKFSFAADVLDRQFKSYARALFRSLPRPGCSRRNL